MRRRQFLSICGGAALAPLASWMSYADAPAGCPAPGARDDGWATTSNGDIRIDADALCLATDRLATSGANVHALLVARGGTLAFERYLKGDDEVPGRIYGRRVETVAFDADTLHDMKSVSKSVASLAFGIALERGLIRTLDQPVFDFFPDLSDLRTPEKDRILLRHVLTMSMGLDWVEATPETGDFNNDEARMNMAWNPVRYVLGRPVTAPAGQGFFYNTGALRLVAAILQKAAGRSLEDFARETLLEPLGIKNAVWEKVRGETDAGGGLRLRPRDMMKFGELVRTSGRWNGRQIVPETWIEASTTPKIDATDGMSYGYLWWLGRARVGQRDMAWIAAFGRGGQSIRIVPERDLVVAVTAGYYQDYTPKAFRLLNGVFRDVLKATSPPD